MAKRGILSTVSSIFNQLGFLAPFTLKAKLLIQSIWCKKLEWDEEMPVELQKNWKRWLQGISEIKGFEVKRCYHQQRWQCSNIQLHIFCDALKAAYRAVGYLRFEFKDRSVCCSFVIAQSKLAPIKTLTMARLELNAAVIGVKLFNLIIHEIDLPIQKVKFWSDSMLTLQYIQGQSHRFNI